MLDVDSFRWCARAWHLTYAGHVPPQVLLLLLAAATSVKVLGTSIVHEVSDAEVPYDQTHFSWLWAGPVNLHGAHIMDAFGLGRTIHPHVRSTASRCRGCRASLSGTITATSRAAARASPSL